MQSLDERKADRKKRVAENEKLAGKHPAAKQAEHVDPVSSPVPKIKT